jgi:hypothetical protein
MLGTHADVCFARLFGSASAAEGGGRGADGGAAAQQREHESFESADKGFQNRVREVRRRARLLRNFQAARQGDTDADTDTGCSVTLGVVGGVQPSSLGVGGGGSRSGGREEEGSGVVVLEEEAAEKGGGRKRGGRRGGGLMWTMRMELQGACWLRRVASSVAILPTCCTCIQVC